MITLQRHYETTIPIEVEGILPDRLAGLSEAEIDALPVWLGREQIQLADLFRVRIESGDDLTLRWTGSLTNVHWIGAGLKTGNLEIDSPAGRHVGSQMIAGSIIVRGSVGDFAGTEMRGGLLKINGDAGNHLGGCYPGSRLGMNGGEIVVGGNAGQGVGEWMRRGLIAVAGSVDRLCGWNMLAGSIIVGGHCGGECGSGMIRGTIVQLGSKPAPLTPTFVAGGVYQGGALSLLAKRLNELGFDDYTSLLNDPFQMFHGDQLCGGRGELFVVRKN